MGDMDWDATALKQQTLAKTSYNWSKLSLYISFNNTTDDTTMQSYVNVGVGTQIVTVGAAATGLFQDVDPAHVDPLVDGDLFCWYVATSGVNGKLVAPSFMVSLLSETSSLTIQQCSGTAGLLNGATCWSLGGYIGNQTNEAYHKYKVETAAIHGHLRIYGANADDGDDTIRYRVNGINGNQIVIMAFGTSGSYEDADPAHTDSLVPGDEFNTQNTHVGTLNASGAYLAQVESSSVGRIMMQCNNGTFDYPDTDRYGCWEGQVIYNTPEAAMQVPALTSLTLKNAIVNVITNVGTAAIFQNRKNGVNGTVVLTIASGTTGYVEDVANSDTYGAADTFNWKYTFSSYNVFTATYVGIEVQPTGVATGTRSFIPNQNRLISMRMI
jgi:hypothetical protein